MTQKEQINQFCKFSELFSERCLGQLVAFVESTVAFSTMLCLLSLCDSNKLTFSTSKNRYVIAKIVIHEILMVMYIIKSWYPNIGSRWFLALV